MQRSQLLALNRSVAPAQLAVRESEVKRALAIDGSEHDGHIRQLIKAAVDYTENLTGRALITQTWVLTLDRFPGFWWPIELPRAPLQSVSSIGYEDNGTQTLSSSLYTVDTVREPGRVVPALNETWPTTDGHINDVTITYVAGYGADQSAVPENIKLAITQLVGHWFECREGAGTMAITSIPWGIDDLLLQERTQWLG